MLFNSIDFAIFLPIVFALYWFVVNKNLRLQNILIVVASYIFYGWWDWRFLGLILVSTLVDYFVGVGLLNQDNKIKRKALLWISIVVNLGLLGFFKYYNFFQDSFVTAFTFFGGEIKSNSLNIILPVGISFYTFQTMSYSIDAYRRQLTPTKDFIIFAAYVTFFPQLVAGPIERAKDLLPQFEKKRTFDYTNAVDGLRQILWGLFKKIVIADNCAEFANLFFNNSADYGGSVLVLGALFFTFQIYGDFSGYSDIAIGTSRLFGINLMQNFNYPYFARDIAEFWRRWHISLTTWLRDYLYIPLGGSRGGTSMKIRNTFVIFILSGLWHGANWTFVVYGLLNAIYFLPLLLAGINRNHIDIVARGKNFPTVKEFVAMTVTFWLVVLTRIFFRANDIEHAFDILAEVFSLSLFTVPEFNGKMEALTTILLVLIFMLIEWYGRDQPYALAKIGHTWKRPLRHAMYYALIISLFWLGGEQQQFVYFQF